MSQHSRQFRLVHAAWLPAITLLAAAASALAQATPRVLLDRDLNPHLVEITGLSATEVHYIDDSGLIRSEPLAEHLALLPPTAAAPATNSLGTDSVIPTPLVMLAAPGSGLVRTVDGQAIVGVLESQNEDDLLWKHPQLGAMRLPLDRVSTILFKTSRRQPVDTSLVSDQTEDRVLLVNGDRLSGLLETIHPTLRIEQDGRMREVPIETVAQIALANPAMPATGPRVWLSDGSTLEASMLSMAHANKLSLKPRLAPNTGSPGAGGITSGDPAIPISEVVAIAFDASRLRALADIPPTRKTALGGRLWADAPRILSDEPALLDAQDIELPGPMEVAWTIPSTARRLAFQAELPPAQWTWGDCTLVVLLDGQSLASVDLSGVSPRADISVPVRPSGAKAPELVIRLEPGRFGPVQDRVILHHPLVLVTPSAPTRNR